MKKGASIETSVVTTRPGSGSSALASLFLEHQEEGDDRRPGQARVEQGREGDRELDPDRELERQVQAQGRLAHDGRQVRRGPREQLEERPCGHPQDGESDDEGREVFALGSVHGGECLSSGAPKDTRSES
jgi:hypothetical protein